MNAAVIARVVCCFNPKQGLLSTKAASAKKTLAKAESLDVKNASAKKPTAKVVSKRTKMASPKKSPAAKSVVVKAAKSHVIKKAPAKNVVAKNAPAKKASLTKKKKVQSAKPLDASTVSEVQKLISWIRLERLDRESNMSDVLVIKSDDSPAPGSPEADTLAALNLGDLAALVSFDEPGSAPQFEVVKRIGERVALRANATALRMVRRSSPGLRIFQSAYLYPQYIHPLGEELAAHTLTVGAGVPSTSFNVKVTDGSDAPISGMKVRAVLDTDNGTQVEATTNGAGVATLKMPNVFPRVALVMVEPLHTYWSQYAQGFLRTKAPATLKLQLKELLPDAFGLMQNYAAADPTAGKGVKVGVIDSGVGPHDDLTVMGGACLVSNEEPLDFLDNGIGHGTHVAGIIAGKASNGLYGLAPGCTLMAYRVCPRTGDIGRAKSVDVALAIEQAITDGCDLVNISLGSLEAMPEVPEILEKARNAGMVIFAATGNDGKNVLRYPARYSHAVGIGALGRLGSFPDDSPEKGRVSSVVEGNEFVASFSNYGTGTDFIGLGVSVLSTYPGNKYAMMSGTSFSTPFIAGMAARALSKDAVLLAMPRNAARADAIIQKLTTATRKLHWDGVYGGFGILL